ncbi:MAG: HDOD domain-containing protein [Pirellulaceae bacterium]
MTVVELWNSHYSEEYESRFGQFQSCPFTMRIATLLKSAHVRKFAAESELEVPESIFESDGVDVREMRKRALERIDYDTVVPPLPAVVEKIDRVISSPDVNFKQVAEVVALDPALVTKILKLVNSPLYSLSREVKTIEQAVSFLGIKQVRHLTLTVSVVSSFEKNVIAGLDLDLYWQHSLMVAIGSRILAKVECDRGDTSIDPDEAFLAGLVHDVGRILIASNFHDEQKQIAQRVMEHQDSYLDAELSILGYRHTDIGHALTKRWNLSEQIQAAVLFHHEPISQGPLPAIVSAADTLAHGLGFYTYTDKIQASDPSIWTELDLSDLVIETAAMHMLEQFDAVRETVA